MGSLKHLFKSMFIWLDPLFALMAMIGWLGVFARRAMASSNRILPLTRRIFRACGYLPIRDHYYEPLTFSAVGFKYRERLARLLFREKKDFAFLQAIARPEEFKHEYEQGVIKIAGFHFGNGAFDSGDAETLFYFVRGVKPKKIIEIGAGNSSKIIQAALKLNAIEGGMGEHIIIEPYENPWLESMGCRVIRQRVEEVDFSIFQKANSGMKCNFE